MFQQQVLQRFFRQPQQEKSTDEKNNVPVARAVLVDMEPKAIDQTITFAEESGRWKYDKQSKFHKQSGSANNWAFG